MLAGRPGWPPAEVIDVGAGSAVWSLPIAESSPETRVTAVDFPEVLGVTREFADWLGVVDRYRFLAGDLRSLDLGADAYDLAILGNICHSEGAEGSRRLLRKVGRAVRAGGQVAIVEILPDAERPLAAALFALNMVVHTREGDVFSRDEYATWLAEAGFGPPDEIAIPGRSPVLVARRK